ncbi:MAG: ATP-binding protein [Candidatus Krumholzibacteria bacterium]|nr:ATP-binding protein [Candidatus Krumholzibacteria bacterium]
MPSQRSSSRKRLVLAGSFLAAFALVVVATTLVSYRRARSYLDDQLGERLRAVASGLAQTLALTAADSIAEASADGSLIVAFLDAQQDNLLSNIVLLDPDGVTILDLSGYSPPGEPNPFVEMDFSAVTMARSGIASYTRLYRTGDVFMKSAYAPVISSGGDVVALVGVEAGAGFFTQLREFTGVALAVSAAGLAVLLALAVVFYRQSRKLDRAEEAVLRKENLAIMGRMVANVAHEIRNPLSVIRTSAQRIRRKHGVDDELIDYICEEVDDLDRVLTAYLQFAQAGASAPTPESGRRIVARCLVAAQSEAASRGVTIHDAPSPDDVVLLADEKRVRQAVLNVLLNAVQASPAGARVDISMEASGGDALIIVTDRGPGIAAADLPEVTKPFFTRKAGGSGLGLSIVKAIVEEHGGRLDIHSRPAEGTRVTLAFPLAPARS